jgi:hypothetical protein
MTSPITFDAETLRCIMDAKLVIRGDRVENDMARKTAQTIDCSVFGGEIETDSDGQLLPSKSRRWNVLFIRKDWLDHKLPQTGDAVQVVGYPDMKVIHVMEETETVDLLCRSTGEVPR